MLVRALKLANASPSLNHLRLARSQAFIGEAKRYSWAKEVDKEIQIMEIEEERRDQFGRKLRSRKERKAHRKEEQEKWVAPHKKFTQQQSSNDDVDHQTNN